MNTQVSRKRRDGPRDHHYALEAVSLVLKGRIHLQEVIECDRNRHSNLLDLDQSLRSVEQYLHGYVLQLLEMEINLLSSLSRTHERSYQSVMNHDLCKRTRRSTALQDRGKVITDETVVFSVQDDGHGNGINSAEGVVPPSSCSCTERVQESVFTSLSKAVAELRRVTLLKEKCKSSSNVSKSITVDDFDSSICNVIGARKSSEDYLLFRLIVILQLCLVRIQEADTILCTRRLQRLTDDDDHSHSRGSADGDYVGASHAVAVETYNNMVEDNEGDTISSHLTTRRRKTFAVANVGLSFISSLYLYSARKGASPFNLTTSAGQVSYKQNYHVGYSTWGESWSIRLAQSSLFLSTTLLLRRCWRLLCMNARLGNTVLLVDDWCAQWNLIESISFGVGKIGDNEEKDDILVHEQRCRRILQLIPVQSTQSSVWHHLSLSDTGALRFSFIKWFMNMLYASVGTALQVLSGGKQIHQQQELNVEPQRFWGKFLSQILMSVTAAAAASFYAIVGPSTKSAQVTASMIDYTESHQATHASSVDLLQHTWGMVSLPAVKSVSLQVSRLLKRAAIAERIILGGLPCFILSQPNCPEIVVALNRQRRHEDRRRLSKLNTIFESAYDDSTESHNPRTSSRIVNVYDYPRRDVIIHLTGGGFFAHTIAGDVPFLLDWSADCKAVVLIPEYSLLPEHCFPKALEEITQLYVGLRNGSYVSIIGFHANKIIVTGESSGGNLGAALCVKLCLGDRVKNISVDYDSRLLRSAEVGRLNDPSGVEVQQSQNSMNVRMPDAIMFCCPMLNLSPELTPSRIFGNADPVLPSSLLLVISAAYTRDKSIPECVAADGTLDCQLKDDLRKVHEIHELKKNPLISPIFTPDDILRLFPPTLLYGSSEDPFLDDSVTFNARLRSLGVDSDLRATRHMAHAFWGLGTAGFPEAMQAQRECREWLRGQFLK